MTSRSGAYESYKLGSGEPNPVAEAARAFLRAAQLVHGQTSSDCDTYWLYVPDWHVVHHMSFIAVELFLKSLDVTIRASLDGDESGPYDEMVVPPYKHHHVDPSEFPEAVWQKLQSFLTRDQLQLINGIEGRKASMRELSIGRYPYEQGDEERPYPACEDGRVYAEKWMGLAEALRDFRQTYW